jgi:DNA-binding CsgD family transcriptional regulator/tetratricopeptide (TPR) repeat protein
MLERLLAEADSGQFRTALIGGDAGVGKSRLTSELTAAAQARGATVLSGACVDLQRQQVPYSALVDAFRGLQRATGDDLGDLIGSRTPALLELMPELSTVSQPRTPSTGLGTPGRVLQEVTAVLDGLADRATVVWVVEDAQWADVSMLDLLAFEIKAARQVRLLLVVTYRTTDVRKPMRATLSEWARAAGTTRIELSGLDQVSVAAQMQGILGHPAETPLVAEIFRRSEGNAFAVEEMTAAATAAENVPLTDTLRDLMLARVERLREPTARVVRIAAVGGRAVRHRLLAKVCGIDEQELDDALHEAVDDHIFSTDNDTGYRFRHALLHEVVYAELLPGERVRWHSSYGHALRDDSSLANSELAAASEAAYHFLAANDTPAGLAKTIDAARLAAAASAYPAAQQQWDSAIALWPKVPAAERISAIDRAAILAESAHACNVIGDYDVGYARVSEAIDLVGSGAGPGSEGERTRLALLLESRASIGTKQGLDCRADLLRALELVPRQPPTPATAKVLVRFAQCHAMMGDFAASLPIAEDALAAARQAAAGESEGWALHLIGIDHAELGHPEQAVVALRDAVAAARGAGSDVVALNAAATLADQLSDLGRHSEAIALGRETTRRAEAANIGWSLTASLASTLAQGLLAVGEWDEAYTLATTTDARYAEPHFAALLSWIDASVMAGRGEWKVAKAVAEPVFAAIESHYISYWEVQRQLAALLIDIAVGHEHPSDGRRVAEQALDLAEENPLPRYDWPLFASIAHLLGETAKQPRTRSRKGDDSSMQQRVAALAKGLAVRTPTQEAWRATVDAELTTVDGSHEPAPWEDAAEKWRKVEQPFPLGYALYRLGVSRLADSDSQGAKSALAEAATIAQRLGAHPLAELVHTQARRARITLSAAQGTASTHALATAGLTEREVDVLRLLAAGRTNAQIGSALFITVKTAGTHVSHVLAKLGVATRGEAAALAHRQHLFADER